MMSEANWPRACVGCGTTKGELKENQYDLLGEFVPTVNQIGRRTKTPDFVMKIKPKICKNCIKKGWMKVILFTLIGVILNIIPFIFYYQFTYSFNTWDDPFYLFYPIFGSITDVVMNVLAITFWIMHTVGVFGPLYLIYKRFRVSKHYHNVHKKRRKSMAAFYFKNLKFAMIFQDHNPDADVRMDLGLYREQKLDEYKEKHPDKVKYATQETVIQESMDSGRDKDQEELVAQDQNRIRSVPDNITCKKCGTKNPSSNFMCESCGSSL